MNRRPCGTCGVKWAHSHAPMPNRVAAAARALGFVLLLALALVAIQAHAQGLGAPIGDPCAPGAYDPDAGVALALDVPLADGGAEDLPVALCPGQRAPVPLVAFTVRENAKRVGERAGLRSENAALRHALEQADAKAPALLGTLAGVATTVLVIWCSGHQCNPLHGGK